MKTYRVESGGPYSTEERILLRNLKRVSPFLIQNIGIVLNWAGVDKRSGYTVPRLTKRIVSLLIFEKNGENKTFWLRRSLFVVKNIRRGEVFTNDNVRSIRPAFGLCASYMDKVIGRVATRSIKRNTPLEWRHVK